MAAGIAHEIRNPLSSIAGSVKVLSEVAALDDEQKMLVEIVKRESERLNSIISDFLMYTREKQYEFRLVDLAALLDETLTLLENRQPHADKNEREIKLVRDFRASRALTVGDRDRLKQVFWNIADNAFRAMPDGGTLTVTLNAEDNGWFIGFADTGRGMAGSHIEKIFEPFQSEFAGGTGLGLAIVYQIVQAHDGKITVRSAPGKGADFVIRLKSAAEPEPELAVAALTGKVSHG
jgi:two-component system sensor histidine kinase PilS (NtrC family)